MTNLTATLRLTGITDQAAAMELVALARQHGCQAGSVCLTSGVAHVHGDRAAVERLSFCLSTSMSRGLAAEA